MPNLELLVDLPIQTLLFKQIREVQNTLLRQRLHHINVVGGIFRAFGTDLVAVKNAKALQHCRGLLCLSSGKMVEGSTCVISHVLACDFRLHYRAVRINLIEVIVQANRRCEVNGIVEGEIAVIASLQDFYQLFTLFVIHHIEASVLIFAEIFNQFFTKDICLSEISVLIFAFAYISQTARRSIHGNGLFDLII